MSNKTQRELIGWLRDNRVRTATLDGETIVSISFWPEPEAQPDFAALERALDPVERDMNAEVKLDDHQAELRKRAEGLLYHSS